MTLVDCDVRVWRRPCSPDSSATAEFVKVPFLSSRQLWGWLIEMFDIRDLLEMLAFLYCQKVGDVNDQRGLREDMHFVGWVSAAISR